MPKANSSPDRLSACLAIINYMFSNDGQILMSYGPMGENNDISGDRTSGFTADNKGWWVGEEYTAKSIDEVAYKPEGSDQYYVKPEYAAECFAYQNKLYTCVYYKGQQQPQLTTATLELFYGYSVNGLQVGKEASDANPIGNIGVNLSYTNFARNIIGSAQPMGNKLQSFEYQCSAEIGIEGADLVLFVKDASLPPSEEERALERSLVGKPVLTVLNKGDVAKYPRSADLTIEAKTGKNVDRLIEMILERFKPGDEGQGAMLRERHVFAVRTALAAVQSALDGYDALTNDCLIVDVKAAYRALASLTGEDVEEAVVDRIFSTFCVGK